MFKSFNFRLIPSTTTNNLGVKQKKYIISKSVELLSSQFIHLRGKLATNLIAFRGIFQRCDTQHQHQPEQSIRITQPQKVPHQPQQLQQGATVGGNSRNSSSSNNNTNSTSSGSGGGGSGGGGGGGGGGSAGHSGFSSGSGDKEIPTTSSAAVATVPAIDYSDCIMYDQHPSIADSYSLVVATSADTNSTSNGNTTIGKIDSGLETQLS
ncbi:hypothetical protein QQG55_22880 [Brugia pahangi]|uniref:Uncharacterized protein n=1 Tax=Brugia pahangi TaxID=6280 RepID=A0A0N4SWN5_BRUPA|nr:unnamed protein product [Brugia pahangi]